MHRKRYRDALLEELERVDVDLDLQDDPNGFLSWVTAQMLVDQDLDKGRRLLAEQLRRPSATKNTRGDVIEWAALAAAALLLGEDWVQPAEKSLSRLEAALESYGDNDRILEPAVGLAVLRGDGPEAATWRARRLALPLPKDAEALGFELLYLSSGHTGDVPLESLALAVTRLVATNVVGGSPVNTAAPIVCTLARLALDRGHEVAMVLRRRIDDLDRLTFGQSGSRPLVEPRKPALSLRRGDAGEATAEIRVDVTGSGVLSSGAHSIEALGPGLLPAINQLKDRLEDPGNPETLQGGLFDGALFREGGRLRGVLSLGPEVELSGQERVGFQGRLAVAWEHAERRDRRIRATASLDVERA